MHLGTARQLENRGRSDAHGGAASSGSGWQTVCVRPQLRPLLLQSSHLRSADRARKAIVVLHCQKCRKKKTRKTRVTKERNDKEREREREREQRQDDHPNHLPAGMVILVEGAGLQWRGSSTPSQPASPASAAMHCSEAAHSGANCIAPLALALGLGAGTGS